MLFFVKGRKDGRPNFPSVISNQIECEISDLVMKFRNLELFRLFALINQINLKL